MDTAEILTPLGGDEVRCRFTGPFQGDEVVWDATLLTLAHHASTLTPGTMVRNFIDIGEGCTDGIPIRIGLDVEQIDAATVRMAMIMIRQYKRLSPGRHEYGQPRHFPPL